MIAARSELFGGWLVWFCFKRCRNGEWTLNDGELDFAKFVDLIIYMEWITSNSDLSKEFNGNLRSQACNSVEIRSKCYLDRSQRSWWLPRRRQRKGYQCCKGRIGVEEKNRHGIKSLCKKTMGNMFYVFSYWGNLGKHWETEGNGLLSNAKLKITLPGQAEGGLDLRDFHFQEQTTRLTNSKRAHYPTRSHKVHV